MFIFQLRPRHKNEHVHFSTIEPVLFSAYNLQFPTKPAKPRPNPASVQIEIGYDWNEFCIFVATRNMRNPDPQ